MQDKLATFQVKKELSTSLSLIWARLDTQYRGIFKNLSNIYGGVSF